MAEQTRSLFFQDREVTSLTIFDEKKGGWERESREEEEEKEKKEEGGERKGESKR